MEKEDEGRVLERDETVLKNMRSLSKTDNHGVKMSDMKFPKPLQRRERKDLKKKELARERGGENVMMILD